MKILRSFTVSVAFYSIFATSSHFWKFLDSFWKTHRFSKPAHTFRTFWEVLLILSHSTANLLPSVVSDESIFFGKPVFSQTFSNSSNFLRRLTNSTAFYSKFASFSCFWWINFFRKTRIFPKSAQILRTFWDVLLILLHSTANLLALHFLKKSWFFVKSANFISKNPSTYCFEKSYLFSLILHSFAYL